MLYLSQNNVVRLRRGLARPCAMSKCILADAVYVQNIHNVMVKGSGSLGRSKVDSIKSF